MGLRLGRNKGSRWCEVDNEEGGEPGIQPVKTARKKKIPFVSDCCVMVSV